MVNQGCAQVRNPHEAVVFARAIVIGGVGKKDEKGVQRTQDCSLFGHDNNYTARSWHNMLQNSAFSPVESKTLCSNLPIPRAWFLVAGA